MSLELNSLIIKIIEAGYQLSPEAYIFLQKFPKEIAEIMITSAIEEANKNSDRLVLDQSFIEAAYNLKQTKPSARVRKPRSQEILSNKIASNIQYLGIEKSVPASDVTGFTDYFRSRYEKLDSILRKRIDARESVTFERISNLPLKSQVKTIGMVTQKRTRGSRLFLEMEDLDRSYSFMLSNPEVVRNGLQIQPDQVICVDSVKYTEDLLIVNNIIWPDIPDKPPSRSQDPVCAALLSDIHVGSNFFREDLFYRFIEWLNLESDERSHRELASRIKYLVIAGDLIDGVGVYPDQIDELSISTISEQYDEAVKLMKEIPDHIEIIIIPGNHDAVRKSIPQPPIPKKYCQDFYEAPRINLYENPCQLALHGVNVLVCHGKSLDDVLSSTPGQDFQYPSNGIEVLLRARHLAPSYGQSTPIAPESFDRLVIERVPDLLHMGHVHIHETKKYKGTTIVASGTFQDQTPFQKRMKIAPTTGVVSIFDLQTHKLSRLDLRDYE